MALTQNCTPFSAYPAGRDGDGMVIAAIAVLIDSVSLTDRFTSMDLSVFPFIFVWGSCISPLPHLLSLKHTTLTRTARPHTKSFTHNSSTTVTILSHSALSHTTL